MPDASQSVRARTGTTAALRLPSPQLTVIVPEGMGEDERVILKSTDDARTYRRALAPSQAQPSPDQEGYVVLVFEGLSPDLAYTLVLDHDGREDDEAGDEVLFEDVPLEELKRLERGEEVGETWMAEEAEMSEAQAESLMHAEAEDDEFGDDLWNLFLAEEGLDDSQT